jgi:hypothetical protein
MHPIYPVLALMAALALTALWLMVRTDRRHREADLIELRELLKLAEEGDRAVQDRITQGIANFAAKCFGAADAKELRQRLDVICKRNKVEQAAEEVLRRLHTFRHPSPLGGNDLALQELMKAFGKLCHETKRLGVSSRMQVVEAAGLINHDVRERAKELKADLTNDTRAVMQLAALIHVTQRRTWQTLGSDGLVKLEFPADWNQIVADRLAVPEIENFSSPPDLTKDQLQLYAEEALQNEHFVEAKIALALANRHPGRLSAGTISRLVSFVTRENLKRDLGFIASQTTTEQAD